MIWSNSGLLARIWAAGVRAGVCVLATARQCVLCWHWEQRQRTHLLRQAAWWQQPRQAMGPGRQRPEAHGLVRARLIKPAFLIYQLYELGLQGASMVGATMERQARGAGSRRGPHLLTGREQAFEEAQSGDIWSPPAGR